MFSDLVLKVLKTNMKNTRDNIVDCYPAWKKFLWYFWLYHPPLPLVLSHTQPACQGPCMLLGLHLFQRAAVWLCGLGFCAWKVVQISRLATWWYHWATWTRPPTPSYLGASDKPQLSVALVKRILVNKCVVSCYGIVTETQFLACLSSSTTEPLVYLQWDHDSGERHPGCVQPRTAVRGRGRWPRRHGNWPQPSPQSKSHAANQKHVSEKYIFFSYSVVSKGYMLI